MMPKEPAFKDGPTGIHIDFATFSIRENIRIQSAMRANKAIVMVSVEPDKFEQYCENYDKDRNWQSLTNFADAKILSTTNEREKCIPISPRPDNEFSSGSPADM